MWDLPKSGIEPVCIKLQGIFLTPGPPGKFPETYLDQTFTYTRLYSNYNIKYLTGTEMSLCPELNIPDTKLNIFSLQTISSIVFIYPEIPGYWEVPGTWEPSQTLSYPFSPFSISTS